MKPHIWVSIPTEVPGPSPLVQGLLGTLAGCSVKSKPHSPRSPVPELPATLPHHPHVPGPEHRCSGGCSAASAPVYTRKVI